MYLESGSKQIAGVDFGSIDDDGHAWNMGMQGCINMWPWKLED